MYYNSIISNLKKLYGHVLQKIAQRKEAEDWLWRMLFMSTVKFYLTVNFYYK